jgi:Transport protein particle (TRAPP) complex subunit
MSTFDPVMPPYNSSDPSARFLSASCLDFLLIELVPMAYRVTNDLEQAAREKELSSSSNTSSNPTPIPGNGVEGEVKNGGWRIERDFHALENEPGAPGSVMDEEEEREAVFWRLERIGYRVGQGLVERFSKDRPRFNDTLDVIKFLCKDLWTLVFRKQVDNLKTNHRVGSLSPGRGTGVIANEGMALQGVYVLTDNSFRPFARMSAEVSSQAVMRAQPVCYSFVLSTHILISLTQTAIVPLVPLRHRTRRAGGNGHHSDSAG